MEWRANPHTTGVVDCRERPDLQWELFCVICGPEEHKKDRTLFVLEAIQIHQEAGELYLERKQEGR